MVPRVIADAGDRPPGVSSSFNVRTVKTGFSIEELSEDISHRGLLQNLYVRPVIGADGEETGFYEVRPAAGAIAPSTPVKAKRRDKAVPVPCIVRETGIAEEDCFRHVSARSSCAALRRIQAALVLVLRRLVSVDVPLHKIAKNLRRGSFLEAAGFQEILAQPWLTLIFNPTSLVFIARV